MNFLLHACILKSFFSLGAAQPAEQLVCQALHSITDVQRWLKDDEAALTSSAEAMRIREVVDALSKKPQPRHEAIACFFKLWGVQQCIKKARRPLPELIG